MSGMKAFAEMIGRQIRAGVTEAVAPLEARVARMETELRALPVPKDGKDGRDGIDGKDGAPGVNGKDGAAGVNGQDGAAGRDGEPGLNGKDGAAGLNGKDGAPGERGADGVAGRDGIDGKAGIDGINGKDGAAGINGKDGAAGRDGIDGKHGADGINGQDGAAGRDGIEGKDGADGINGKDGAAGINGKDGAAGINGKDGAAGRDGIECKDGADGINGKDGAPGINGKDGAAGRDGIDGRHGIDGINGKNGEDGRDALAIVPLPGIDDTRSYARSTYACHDGGLVYALRKTDPLQGRTLEAAGWSVVLEGIAALLVTQGENERDIIVSSVLTGGKTVAERLRVPVMINRGLYRTDESYERGDVVTWDGSTWHKDAAELQGAPGTDNSGWTLIVKRGRAGRNADGTRVVNAPLKL